MKFEELRLSGFKSFVDATAFRIEGGLTGVVGPNGCGKSNLVEALRWAMGETSYKNMRASSMEDVIFSGNTHRPARNSAEVALVLDNSEGGAPAAFNDQLRLEITRKIQRDAGSAYRVNGKEVRARDVQLLFADASTGARSPAMVRQGEIAEIIAQKPTQRRHILEEAAGITGLHTRRHEAELRLKGAEQNLLRLEDVLTTMESQLDSLKKQAKQASRFRNLSGEIRKVEAGLLYLRFVAAADRLHDDMEALKAATSAVSDCAERQAQSARDQAVAAHELPALRDHEAERGAAVKALIVAREQLDGEEQRAAERLRELETRLTHMVDDLAREEQQALDNRDQLARLQDEERQLREAEDGADAAIEAARAAVSLLTAQLADLEQRLADKTRDVANLDADRRGLERQLRDTRQDLERNDRKQTTLNERLQQISASLADLDQGEDLAGLLDEARDRLEAAEATREAAELATEEAREREADLRDPLSEAERHLQSIQTEIKTLSRILADTERSDDETPLVDQLQVPAGLERALGAALGDDMNVPISQSAALRWSGADSSTSDPRFSPDVTPLLDLIKAPPELARRLAHIGLIDNVEAGARLSGSLASGQMLVSRSGAIWRWDGFCQNADAPSAAAERIATRNRLASLQAAVPPAETDVETAKTALATARRAIEACRLDQEEAQNDVRSIQEEMNTARDRAAAMSTKRANLTSQQSSQRDHLSALEQSRARLTDQIAELVGKLEALPDLSALEAAIQTLRTEAAEGRAAVSEARVKAESLERERSTRSRRLESLGGEAARVIRRIDGAEAHRATLEERYQQARQELDALRDRPDDFAARRRALIAQSETAEEALRQAADARVKGESQLKAADEAAKQANEGLGSARETHIRADERVTAGKEKLHLIQQRIEQDLDCGPLEAGSLAGFVDGQELPSEEALERRLDRLKAERERLGGVNLRASEEHESLTADLEKLIGERDDLISAIAKLRQAVASLNRTAREKLLASFNVVQGHFHTLFTTLFGGGTAELRLVDSDDPLTAGLEIFARPPGKKPQTMTLLSGGEQALTTLALIFAVFLTNPAPICVLDEVDAPLDDANVERFCDLLDSMVQQSETRFLTITHNPITMARMNRLYGVTMVERGVSQLVSISLDDAEQLLEAV